MNGARKSASSSENARTGVDGEKTEDRNVCIVFLLSRTRMPRSVRAMVPLSSVMGWVACNESFGIRSRYTVPS